MDLPNKIRLGIDQWIEQKPRRNLAILSRLSKVPYGSLRRIYQSGNRPSPENAIALAQVIYQGHELTEFLKDYYPAFYEAFQKVSYSSAPKESEFLNFLNSRDHFAVITLAATVCGTTRTTVEQKLGGDGLLALDELLDTGHLVEREDAIFASDADFSVMSPRLVLTQLKHCLDLYDVNDIKLKRGATYNLYTEGLNDEGLVKVGQILQQAAENILDIVKNEQYRGPNVWFGGLFSNTLTHENGER
jgi:hypothetical protein